VSDKSSIIGLVVAALALFLYFGVVMPIIAPKQPAPGRDERRKPTPGRLPETPPATPKRKTPDKGKLPTDDQEKPPKKDEPSDIIARLPEQPLHDNIQVETDMFRFVLTNRGAAIRSVTFNKGYYAYPGEQEPLTVITEIEEGVPSLTMKHAGGRGELDTVHWLHETAGRDPAQSPAVERFKAHIPELGLVVTKTFRFYDSGQPDEKGLPQPGRHVIVDVSVENRSRGEVLFPYRLRSAAGMVPEPEGPRRSKTEPGRSEEQQRLEQRQSRDVEALVGTPTGPGEVDVETYSRGDEHKGSGDPLYAGAKNRYFVSVLKPLVAEGEATGIAAVQIENIGEHNVTTDLETRPKILPGQTFAKRYMFFVAPRSPAVLREYADHHFEELLAYGWLGPIIRPLSWLLRFFGKITPNYGWAIVLLTLCVRLLLHPLSLKSQKSAHKMQRIQPLISAAKEKFKHDKRQQQQEVMKIMREQGANPLGGCLPMLLQLPIFIGLWRALYQDVSLRHAPFLLWINDLSKPDNLVPLSPGSTIPILGWTAINLLPLLCAAAMIGQQRMMPKSSDPQAQQTQKIMMFMPVLFAFLLYNMPSGLMVYFLVSSLFGMLEQRHIRGRLDAVAAAAAADAPPPVPVEQKRQKPAPQRSKKRRRKR